MSATTLKSIRVEEGNRFIGATFLYLFLSLLFTVVIEFAIGAIMNYYLGSGSLDEQSQAFQV